MEIGLIREIRNAEFRVALTPFGVKQLSLAGHKIKVTQGAGEGAGFAGGILSAGIDGLRVGEAVARHLSGLLQIEQQQAQ